MIKAAIGAPCEGRPIYAALRTIPVPDDVVARLFHAAEPCESVEPGELDELMDALEPLATLLLAAQDWS